MINDFFLIFFRTYTHLWMRLVSIHVDLHFDPSCYFRNLADNQMFAYVATSPVQKHTWKFNRLSFY